MGTSKEQALPKVKIKYTPLPGISGLSPLPMHRSFTMFKAFNKMASHLFNGFGNLFSAFEHVMKVGDLISEEMELSQALESGATARQLQRQITTLEAQAVLPA